jgi:SPP1 family phage portal protein
MDIMLTYDREKVDALGSADIIKLIQKHQQTIGQYEENLKYYLGEQAITNKTRPADAPNAQPVCNHAKDIADTASGYFLGNPLSYKLSGDLSNNAAAKRAFDDFMQAIETATTDDDDQENALSLSIYGKCYEYIYTREGEANLGEKPIDPQNAFIVYDDSIEHEELFGVYYYKKKDELNAQSKNFYYVLVMTASELKYYKIPDGANGTFLPYRVEEHSLGYIPLVEYKNNRYGVGDFEQQIGLIDAYNTMTADRINDKEQFIDAILVLYGAILGDDEEETDDSLQQLKKRKLLQMPEDARAEYLVRQLDEGGMETLRTALKEDIYSLSHVPNLTDENFAGNSSGVAMEYKLLGLEMLTKTKERWYRRGLRKRMQIFLHFLGIKGTALSEGDIEVTFSRSLPKNLLELSQIINNLSDEISAKSLISLLPFIEDPEAELKQKENEDGQETRTAGDSGSGEGIQGQDGESAPV